jgi:hypothetical protein
MDRLLGRNLPNFDLGDWFAPFLIMSLPGLWILLDRVLIEQNLDFLLDGSELRNGFVNL